MPPRYDAVLFDLDGTLSHFDDAPAPDEIAELIAPRLEALIESWGRRPTVSYKALDLALIAEYRASDTAADELHGYRHPDRIESIISTLATYGVVASRQQAQQVRDTLNFDIRILRPRLFEGVLDTIEALRLRGTRLATVTNRSHSAEQIRDELHYHNLAHHFDEVLTAGDIGWLKPHPAIVYAALEALDVSPDRALMVGDDPRRDIAASNAAGVTSVLITHPDRPSIVPSAPHEEPQHTIAAPADLLVLVDPAS